MIESRNRPRLWLWLSSLFQPPWFWVRWKVRSVPRGKAIGFSAVKTALRGWLRRPGPTSVPQAVSSLPSIANPTGPVTRFLPLLSSKIGSSGFSDGLTSAVALENLTSVVLPGASAGAASTRNSVSAAVPLIERPGPPSGRLGSLSSSRRTAAIGETSVFTVRTSVCFVGA